MQVKGRDVIGLNIITVDTGTIIETVDDIAYNPNNHRVEALLVSSGGIFSSAKAIHIDDVRNIGEDAVIVYDANAIKSVKELSDTVHSIADSNKHLVKTNVITIDGKELGSVTDIYFDSTNGNVISLEVSQGGLKTIGEGKKSIKPTDIVTIGADATIVSAYTEIKLEAQGEAGGLKGMINDAKDKASEISSNTKDSIDEAAEKVKQSGRDLRDAAQDKSDELKFAASEMSDDAQRQARDIAQDARQKNAEISESVSAKANELEKIVANKSDAVKSQAEVLINDARVSADEIKADTRTKTNRLQGELDSVAKNMKESVEDVKEKHSHKDGTGNIESHTVVNKESKELKDTDETVIIEKTEIKKTR